MQVANILSFTWKKFDTTLSLPNSGNLSTSCDVLKALNSNAEGTQHAYLEIKA